MKNEAYEAIKTLRRWEWDKILMVDTEDRLLMYQVQISNVMLKLQNGITSEVALDNNVDPDF